MTVSYKVATLAAAEARRGSGASPSSKPQDAAPALFKLLTDSALYRAAFLRCGVPMAIVDAVAAGSPVVHVNPAFERSFGIPESEVRGKSFDSAFFGGNRDAAQRFLASEEAPQDLSVWRKDGAPLKVEASAGPVHDVKGTCTHWVVTFARPGTIRTTEGTETRVAAA